MEIIIGDILKSKEKYIAHQCNCLTINCAGLAKSIFLEFPYANVYKTRDNIYNWKLTRDKPGTINVSGNGVDERYVVNVFGQVFPGKPKFPDSPTDGYCAREKYFEKSLNEILKIENLESIAFPYGIGCNMAGGNWQNYLKMITLFAEKTEASVFLYKKE